MRVLRLWVAAIAAVGLVMASAQAQTANDEKPATKLPTSFETVSIRPAADDSGGLLTTPQGSEFRTTGMELSILVQLAFGINPNQLDLPEWTRTAKFDIAAKTEGGVSLTHEQMKPLLLRMLQERFKLTYHRETRELQGYNLVAAKGGPKLTPAKPGASKNGGGTPTSITLPNANMASLAGMLTYMVKRPVADKTGATGDYEIKLSFARDGDADSTLPSIFTALQEELGLKLDSAKVPVEMIVIDHLEKVPTEN